jgi:hypothetical protein
MDIDQNLNDRKRDEVWIISGGSFVNLDLSNICKESVSGPVTEYRISALAHYLLNPNPIMVEEKINGCKVKYLKPSSGKIKRLIRKIIPQKDDPSDDNNNFVEEIISNSKLGIPSFHDEGLNSHFLKIKELLKPYDPVQKKLSGLDREKIEDITAICDEIGGHRYLLNLKGSVKEKIDFVMNSISKKVRVSFNKAYLLNGLFELRGFKFESYNSNSHYVLIKFTQNNQTRYCVLNADYKFEFWVNDNILVNYIHLFEQSVKTDPKLKESLNLCVKGDAKPLKLFFSKKLEKGYSEKHLPMIYREVFNMYNLNNGEKMAIANALNNFQNVVFFNFFPTSGNSRRKVITNISVMHDFRALEQIKSQLPQLYSEIDKKASVSEAGKLYLLDSFRGYQNV